MSQNFIVLKQESIKSKYGGYITKITLAGIEDCQEYWTYIDTRNRNVTNWWHIINHPQRGYIITGVKIKQTKEGKLLVNADSDPIIVVECEDPSLLFSRFFDIWREPPATQFGNLFE